MRGTTRDTMGGADGGWLDAWAVGPGAQLDFVN